NKEITSDQSQEEIKKNYNILKSKFSNPKTDSDILLYNTLKRNLKKYINLLELLWNNQLANMIVDDNSIL
ncbi:24042_t:CDS:2, partial [Racocetra persica]